MERKQKNLLIGGLIALVFIMAVGFAGFTQRLTVNDSATSTSNWNIGFSAASASTACSTSVTTNCGTVTSFSSGATSISFTTKLASPGSSVTYTATVKNNGNVTAKLNSLTTTPNSTSSLIKYTVTGMTAGTTTISAGATATLTVKVEFQQQAGNIPAQSNNLVLNLDWVQA